MYVIRRIAVKIDLDGSMSTMEFKGWRNIKVDNKIYSAPKFEPRPVLMDELTDESQEIVKRILAEIPEIIQ